MKDGQYGDPEVEVPTPVQHAIDLLNQCTITDAPIGRSGYRFKANSTSIDVGNGMDYEDCKGISLDVETASILSLLLQAWLKWRVQ